MALNRIGEVFATARLLRAEQGRARIGRMAVQAALRGQGVGRLVLHRLIEAARLRGDLEIVLHAQVSAQGFYERSGFAAHGPTFDEAGIPHVEMVRRLHDGSAGTSGGRTN